MLKLEHCALSSQINTLSLLLFIVQILLFQQLHQAQHQVANQQNRRIVNTVCLIFTFLVLESAPNNILFFSNYWCYLFWFIVYFLSFFYWRIITYIFPILLQNEFMKNLPALMTIMGITILMMIVIMTMEITIAYNLRVIT